MFGAPRRVLSDNGSQFLSAIFRAYAQSNGIRNLYSTPYYPQGNGQIERVHRYLKQRLTLIGCGLGRDWHNAPRMVLDDGRDLMEWDDFLPIIQHSYNSVPNSVTRMSANKIVFGRDLALPLDRLEPEDGVAVPPKEWTRKMELRRAAPQSTLTPQKPSHALTNCALPNMGKGANRS